MVICLERGADLHMAQLMPLPLTVSCSGKIQIGFTVLVPAYPGCPGKEAVKWLLLLLFVFSILCHFTFVLSFMLKMCKMMARQALRSSDHFVCELYDF